VIARVRSSIQKEESHTEKRELYFDSATLLKKEK
jgi:hypothetical protein